VTEHASAAFGPHGDGDAAGAGARSPAGGLLALAAGLVLVPGPDGVAVVLAPAVLAAPVAVLVGAALPVGGELLAVPVAVLVGGGAGGLRGRVGARTTVAGGVGGADDTAVAAGACSLVAGGGSSEAAGAGSSVASSVGAVSACPWAGDGPSGSSTAAVAAGCSGVDPGSAPTAERTDCTSSNALPPWRYEIPNTAPPNAPSAEKTTTPAIVRQRARGWRV
jgi:hypothetical protein